MDEEIIAVVAIVCTVGLPFVWGIVYTVCKWAVMAYTYDKEVALKHRLLEAGMTAEEIVRVVESGGLMRGKPKKPNTCGLPQVNKAPAYS